MNKILLLAAIICILTAGIHIIMGNSTVVDPFLGSDLAQVPKLTLFAVWYMVSAVLALTAVMLVYLSFRNAHGEKASIFFFGVAYIVFGLIFLAVCFMHFNDNLFMDLPQWVLLLPIGALLLWELFRNKGVFSCLHNDGTHDVMSAYQNEFSNFHAIRCREGMSNSTICA